MNSQRTVNLTPPHISPAHIHEKITCIRGHRERIFRVSTEIHGNKLICHNYGQGGAGWTFLFGCVNASLRHFEQQVAANPAFANKPIAVIGAGCYGLLTAILLARNGHNIRIIAKDIDNLASFNAAGFFFPRARKKATPHERAIFEAYGIASYKTYLQIIQGDHPFIKSGPKLLPAYCGLAVDLGLAPSIAHGLINAPEKVTIDFGNGKSYDAMVYNTIFIDAVTMMQELQRAIKELGIPITQTEINALSEVAEPIIFNCAGFGAKKLADDKRIVPVQGHLITLKDQPAMEQLNYMINVTVTMVNEHGIPRDELIYYAPKGAGIVGTTFIRGQASLTANGHEFDRLLQRCHDYFGT